MLNLLARSRIPASVDVRLDGRTVALAVRVSSRARAYRLSIPASGQPLLTLPKRGRWSDATAFLERQLPWLAARLQRRPRQVSFAEGAVVPLRGVDHLIAATGQVRGVVRAEDTVLGPTLMVPGEPLHRARRLTDWLKQEAARDIAARVAVHAVTLGVAVKAIRIRGQSTRWGSCSSAGSLNFNWRLILAPPYVLDYVAAHEVAHLVEMNHSKAFWDKVREADPGMDRGRAWLRAHGGQLMAYGR